MPKVSVIIPAYNRAVLLPETIESVLQQTFRDFEIIVVDDGSTDDTAKVVREIASPALSVVPFSHRKAGVAMTERDKNNRNDKPQTANREPRTVKYIYQENRGPGAARNTGIRAARGEYVAFLDSDDIWLQEKLSAQIDLLERHLDTALVFSNCQNFDGKGTPYPALFHYKQPPRGQVFYNLFTWNFIATSSVFVRRECLDAVGPFDETPCMNEDFDMWLRLAARFPIDFTDQILIKHRMHAGNMYTDAPESTLRFHLGHTRALEKMLVLYPALMRAFPTPARKEVARWDYKTARLYLRQEKRSMARRYLARSLRRYPFSWRSLLFFSGIDVLFACKPFVRRMTGDTIFTQNGADHE
jgi:glycosyltransferase involved in cell wall biosynthesis